MKKKKLTWHLILLCKIFSILIIISWTKIYFLEDPSQATVATVEINSFGDGPKYAADAEKCVNQWRNGTLSLKQAVDCLDAYMKQVNKSVSDNGGE